MLIALLSLFFHLPMVVVPHPRIVNYGGPCRHSYGGLLLFPAELRHSCSAVYACSGSVIKGCYAYKTGILTRRGEVLEDVGIYDGVNSCYGPDTHNTCNQVIGGITALNSPKMVRLMPNGGENEENSPDCL